MPLEIKLWLWSLDVGAELADLRAHLNADEIARAGRFVRTRDHDQFIAGRGRLREILGAYIGQAPDKLRFDYNDHGKPALRSGPHFNLSHSDSSAALALCDTHPLGLDIEAHRPVEDAVARRFFAPSEYAALSTLPAQDWSAGFFRCWTRKEAFVKACGPGLSKPLDSFEVSLAPDAPARFLRIDDMDVEDWSLHHLNLGADMTGAIAVENDGTPVTLGVQDGKTLGQRPV